MEYHWQYCHIPLFHLEGSRTFELQEAMLEIFFKRRLPVEKVKLVRMTMRAILDIAEFGQ